SDQNLPAPDATIGPPDLAEPNRPRFLRAFFVEEVRERHIEIRTIGPEPRVVTRIEILSPWKKRPGTRSRAEYLEKRRSLLLGEAHLVEIDLLRGGEKPPMLDPWSNCPYTFLFGGGKRGGVAPAGPGFITGDFLRSPCRWTA